MGDSHVGLQARLMSQALRKITGALSLHRHHRHLHQPAAREDRCVLRQPGDHHWREGSEVLCLRAPGRAPYRRAQGRRPACGQPHPGQGRQEQDGAALQAGRVRHPLRPGHLREGSLLDLGVDNGVVRKSGAWFTYGEDQLGQGKENARNFLKDNPQLAAEIEEKILAALGIGEPGRKAREAEEVAAAEPPWPRPPSRWPVTTPPPRVRSRALVAAGRRPQAPPRQPRPLKPLRTLQRRSRTPYSVRMLAGSDALAHP